MADELSVKEVAILQSLQDYGILSLAQLAVLHFASRQMARIRVRQLLGKGMIDMVRRDFGAGPGRPESLVSLTADCAESLKKYDIADIDMNSLRPWTDTPNIEHQILLNWARIHLVHIERQLPRLKVSFLSPSLLPKEYRVDLKDPELGSVLIPDGIFSITDANCGKSLLFFLEVDMGTETLASADPQRNDLRRKILAYQHIFRTELYKRFQGILNAEFNGFRTLVVANSAGRQKQLCRLAKSLKSTGFIWLTDRDSIFANGISDRVWARGGDTELGQFSILGPTLGFKGPINLPQ